MKHIKNILIAVVFPVLFISFVCHNISAKQTTKTSLSPALSVIASDLEMKKCGLSNTDIYFTYNDFEDFLHTQDFKSITVSSLPSEFEGTLYLKNVPVISNQVIYKKDIKELKFSPSSNSVSKTTFYFSGDLPSCESSVKCTIHLLPEMNTAPTISADTLGGQKLTTQKNIMVYSKLQAEDSENDTINYEIITEAQHGIISVSDNGDYTYTPSYNFVGKDRFEYVAVDTYGNRSESAWIEIDVEKNKNNAFFNDMLKNKDHNSAVKITDYGIMTGKVVDGKMCFLPDYRPTKSEFISMALKAAGIETDNTNVSTGFADDSDIPIHLKNAVAYSVNTGIISGTKTDQGVFLYPNSEITRAEAAVIINNILNIEKGDNSITFNDSQDIPSWASQDVMTLAEQNIMVGMDDGNYLPNSEITNIQAAKIFCKIYEMNN